MSIHWRTGGLRFSRARSSAMQKRSGSSSHFCQIESSGSALPACSVRTLSVRCQTFSPGGASKAQFSRSAMRWARSSAKTSATVRCGSSGPLRTIEVPSVLGVPPVDAGKGVEVLGHLVRPDREVHQVVPAPRVGNHRGRTHVPAPTAGNRYRTDGVLVGGAVGGVLPFARLSVANVEGLGVGGRIGGEPVVLRMLYEGVLPRAVEPVRSDVIGDPEEGEVGVRAPPDP